MDCQNSLSVEVYDKFSGRLAMGVNFVDTGGETALPPFCQEGAKIGRG